MCGNFMLWCLTSIKASKETANLFTFYSLKKILSLKMMESV